MTLEELNNPLVGADNGLATPTAEHNKLARPPAIKGHWCLIIVLVVSILLNVFLGVVVFQLKEYQYGEENGVLSIPTDFNASEDVNYIWYDLVMMCSPKPKVDNVTCTRNYENFDCFNDEEGISISGDFYGGVVTCGNDQK
eukprot:CAMPEP_0194049128 /NCGR_PEP_ID=MMETSP0009_2-20130614/29727_1 /TAXON_ID=210454 /ORGANISM="Grammatophora oceanica, Strain CCMP 410" /LENGTH=140 /DNA_ID=CAMNT_0038695205 /DNA_START=106 /DNA_END=528 /DNA_ORIENTATION=-